MPSYKPGDITKGVVERVARTGLDLVDRGAGWWQLPLPAQLLQLAHFREDPELAPALEGSQKAFAPWKAVR